MPFEYPKTDPYQILGLPTNSSLDDVKRRYKELILLLHPDKELS
jgi:curved DNA-binding protein CbpA